MEIFSAFFFIRFTAYIDNSNNFLLQNKHYSIFIHLFIEAQFNQDVKLSNKSFY